MGKSPHPIHVKKGWTKFLEGCAPINLLDDIEPRDEQGVNLRRRLLLIVYEVAGMEQSYKESGIGELSACDRDS